MGKNGKENNGVFKMITHKKIMTVGDNPKMSTGYGCVWDNLLSRWTKLKPDWKFFHVGWQNMDRPHQTKDGYWMLPRGKDEHSFESIYKNIMEQKPDILLTLADIGKQSGFLNGIGKAKKAGWKGKWLAYSPIDCHQWALHWDEIFMAPDMNIAMAKSGEAAMNAHKVPNVICIPHGVDTEAYFPKEDREADRKKFGIDKKFVCGFVGRNQTRKMIPYVMKGFAKFSKGKDDVMFLLHTDSNPSGGEGTGWSIDCIVNKFEKLTDQDLFKSKKVCLTEDNMNLMSRQSIQSDDMNGIYNLFDLFLYGTGGEGFGLPAIECQSSGVPILMSNNTTGPELAGETGELIDVLKDKHGRKVGFIGTNGVENYIPDDEHVAELLEKYYADWKSNKKLLTEMSKKSRALALTYSWDIISKKWIDLFEKEI